MCVCVYSVCVCARMQGCVVAARSSVRSLVRSVYIRTCPSVRRLARNRYTACRPGSRGGRRGERQGGRGALVSQMVRLRDQFLRRRFSAILLFAASFRQRDVHTRYTHGTHDGTGRYTIRSDHTFMIKGLTLPRASS